MGLREIKEGEVLSLKNGKNIERVLCIGKCDPGKSVLIGQFDERTIVEYNGYLGDCDENNCFGLSIAHKARYISDREGNPFELRKRQLENAGIWEEAA
tara:strand:+ start:1318 stop:1611 length:294 start_codon:yes stop_codon:yes gene_type:complete